MEAAFEVYNELGYGMAEEIYQQSLEVRAWDTKYPVRCSSGTKCSRGICSRPNTDQTLLFSVRNGMYLTTYIVGH